MAILHSAVDRYWSFPAPVSEEAACSSARGRQGFQIPFHHASASRKPTAELPDMVLDLDLGTGLRRAGGDRTAYVNLLRRFGRGQRSFGTQLKEPLARQDWATAERVVRGCGLAAYRIGAAHLAARAQVLEAALNDRPSEKQLRPLVLEVVGLTQALALQLHAQLAPAEPPARRVVRTTTGSAV